MHIIDRKWTDLASGYQAVQSLQARLEAEFGHAVQAGHKQEFRKELSDWQKRRRIFIALAVIAPLSIITLCLTAYYYRDAACVIIYWVILVMIILVTLAVSGRNYIQNMMNRPQLEHAKTLPMDLVQRWWNSLSPIELATGRMEDKGNADLLTLFKQNLQEEYLAIQEPHLLLFGLAGPWLFLAVPWSGTIIRQDGSWKGLKIVRDKLGKEQRQQQILDPAPDDEWLRQKKEVVNYLNDCLPQKTWIGSLLQGGIVFSDPKVILDKSHIQDNTAAYGTAGAWLERLRHAPAAAGFTRENQLEILDSLSKCRDVQSVSAKDAAERLYQEAVEELRLYVTKMVK
jgi:hypothetical protein